MVIRPLSAPINLSGRFFWNPKRKLVIITFYFADGRKNAREKANFLNLLGAKDELMKRVFYYGRFVALSLSCSKKDDGSLIEISYEEAIESQTIKFNWEVQMRMSEILNLQATLETTPKIHKYIIMAGPSAVGLIASLLTLIRKP